MNKATTEKAINFMAKNPTFIGRVKGHDFYESPTYGDEVPLRVITPSGKLLATEYWELPSSEEFTISSFR